MTNILLIEDEASIREMLADELTSLGYKTFEAENGEEGLHKIMELEPDIVICDRAMPRMTGFQLLERLRGVYPQYATMPFVFLTALTDPRDKIAVEPLKAAAYIEKPVDFEKLDSVIKSLVKA